MIPKNPTSVGNGASASNGAVALELEDEVGVAVELRGVEASVEFEDACLGTQEAVQTRELTSTETETKLTTHPNWKPTILIEKRRGEEGRTREEEDRRRSQKLRE